jgi:2-(1,2-epoxy-1,2-dihydrophenyl)acetyl-CoA isomerase
MSYNTITVDYDGQVATLTLNRPQKLNALNTEICDEASGAIKSLNEDDNVKVLIITGAGRAFCSGADLSGKIRATATNQPNVSRAVKTSPFANIGWVTQQISMFTKPTIAAINGPAVGAGLSYALATDIRVASEKALFSCIFVKRGLVPDMGISFYLPRLIGISRAVELMMTGDIIDAAEAERIGMVNRVVPQEQLMPEVKKLAQRLADGPSLAVEMAKRMAYAGLNANSLVSQMAVETYMQTVAMESEDFREGVAAFMEKRSPIFKGK